MRGVRDVQHEWKDVGIIVLAGGRSTRMGADKAQVKVNGTRLVDAVCARIPDDVPRIVVSPKPLGMPTVSEDPPFGGPVAGIAAGLSRIDAPFVAIVSVDAPRSPELIPVLSRAARDGADVAVVEAADGYLQPLCAVWNRASLVAALDAAGSRDIPAKRLFDAVEHVVRVQGTGAERDYDTRLELDELGDVEFPATE
ncbi:molybdenum cofactor guanylyltransferase [Corynebacterium sp. CCUG 55013]|uniref:Molybdenum cofactor guanylyltransferase n=1 Tax=Corynebacterium pseudogenitalium TaxID=38303 RepID=A0ABD4TR99_9CORY|nr:molybdenum cofactor guanylyltransferase [Corynebacterium pseudogenitalium]